MAYKILWLSNCVLTENRTSSTGSWLQTMSYSLSKEGVSLYNITQANVKKITTDSPNGIKQWVLPVYKLHNGLPSESNISSILKIIEVVNPDLIHIWGVESYWGLLMSRGYIDKNKCLVEMQGIKGSCDEVFYGGLTTKEILQSIGLKEWIFFSHSIVSIKKRQADWHKYEKEILNAAKYVSTQSDWVRAWIKNLTKAKIFNTRISVRSDFRNGQKWVLPSDSKIRLFVMSGEGKPYKGIHIAIKALAEVKKIIGNNIELRVAGNFGMTRSSFMKPGYSKYLSRLIQKCGLENNVLFLGSLDSSELTNEMRNSHVMIHPSFVESYSLALAECMTVGTPAVVSFAGAMQELAEDNVSALFYNSGDFRKCAFQICRILDNNDLAIQLSNNARAIALDRNDSKNAVVAQMEIYNKIICNEKC